MSQETSVLYSKKREPSCEDGESCCGERAVIELPSSQHVSAAEVPLLPRAQETTCPKQEGGAAECAANEDVEEGPGSSDETVKEIMDPQDKSATMNKHRKTCKRSLAPGEWIRSHPVLTLVLILLLFLVLALVLALSVQSGQREGQTPVVPDTPHVLACPDDWIGHNGICYFLSRDHLSWDQAQARCSELGASLAVLRDEEMEFLFSFSWKHDYWVGLRRRDQRLQWGDGSSFNSSFEVLGNSECVYLAEGKLRSVFCSNAMSFVCSRAQTRL